jgi:Cu2+-exporting ATPase
MAATAHQIPCNDEFLILDDPLERDEIAREIAPAANGARRFETVLSIDGVHCAACVIAIEDALQDCVDEVSVNAATRRARLVWRADAQQLSRACDRIASLGYRPRPVSKRLLDTAQAAGRRTALWRMLVAVLCMMQVMMYSVPRYVAEAGAMSEDIVGLMTWAERILTLPVMLFAAGPFFTGAWRDLRAWRIGMDVPVALGIAVTFVASLAAGTSGGEVWFDSLTMFVAFLLVGRWLEAAARERAMAGVGDLLARLPERIERLDDRGGASLVGLRQLRPGDRVRVAAGQAVPADGVVEAGVAHVDESLLSGESRPLLRQPGDALAAGSVSLDAPLTMRLIRSARDSRLQEIADLMDSASARKPRLAQLADRWAGPFLGVVLALAAIAWFVWHAIDPSRAAWVAAAVLVVACPCALSLATPAALLAASGRLARHGLLARSPQALEALAQADTFVFDKTGTLTLDRMDVVAVQMKEGGSHSGVQSSAPGDAQAGSLADTQADAVRITSLQARAVAAALEGGSIHPVAAAIVRHAPAGIALPEVRSVREQAGAGIEGEVLIGGRWHRARLGSLRFATQQAGGEGMHEGGVNPHDASAMREAGEAGDVCLSIDGRAAASFTLSETLRPEALSAIGRLREAGMQLEILSGDAPDRVARVAKALGIETWHAQASPEDKLARIEALGRLGRRMAMVGDGINDAPVLARAHVSIAFATGAPLAQHRADLLLLGERLDRLALARDHARQAMRVVRQNLIFATAYNAVGIPLALAGWLPPWLAGLGMAGSSLIVVLNALRLAPSRVTARSMSPDPVLPPLPAH